MEVWKYTCMVVNLKKVSLYIDEERWAKFKEEVFRKYGTLRKLSDEVEVLLDSFLVEDALARAFKDLGFGVKGTISSQEVEKNRPVSRGPSSEELIKEMRRKRIAENLPGQ